MNLLINQALVCEFLGESSHTALAGRWSHARSLTPSLTRALVATHSFSSLCPRSPVGMSSICSRFSESLDEKNPHAVVQQVLSTTTSAHKGAEAWVGALDCGTT